MEEFIQAVREEGNFIEFEVPFKVDGVKGYLSVGFDEVENEYTMIFEWNDGKDRHVILDNVPTPNDVGRWILLIKNGKFYNDEPVFSESKKKWIQVIRKVILEEENRECETCYICLEDTYEFKTPCNHDICYTCFMKTIQRRSESRREFLCGICRKRTDLR